MPFCTKDEGTFISFAQKSKNVSFLVDGFCLFNHLLIGMIITFQPVRLIKLVFHAILLSNTFLLLY